MIHTQFAPRAAPRSTTRSSCWSIYGVAPFVLAAALWLVGATAAAGQTRERDTRADGAALLGEARTFMESYARDLLNGDRPAIAARYDREGAFLVGMGRKALRSHAEIAARYAGPNWRPPASFAFQDLSYEVLGPDAVLVAGRFEWGRQSEQPPIRYSFTVVLRRRNDGLRIRLEDESADPKSIPPQLAPKSE